MTNIIEKGNSSIVTFQVESSQGDVIDPKPS